MQKQVSYTSVHSIHAVELNKTVKVSEETHKRLKALAMGYRPTLNDVIVLLLNEHERLLKAVERREKKA